MAVAIQSPMGMSSRCRAIRVDISDDAADTILSRNVCAASLVPGLKSVWPYPGKTMKQAIQWDAIVPHRQMLFDVFHETGGHLMHQHHFYEQVQRFLVDIAAEDRALDEQGISDAVYRLRLMMGHMRNAKKEVRCLAKPYLCLQPTMELIDISACLMQQGVIRGEEDLTIEELASPATPMSISSDDVQAVGDIVRPHSLDNLDELLDGMFCTSAMAATPPPKRAEETPQSGPKVSRSSRLTPMELDMVAVGAPMAPLTDSELDKLVAGAPKAPSPEEYRAMTHRTKKSNGAGQSCGSRWCSGCQRRKCNHCSGLRRHEAASGRHEWECCSKSAASCPIRTSLSAADMMMMMKMMIHARQF